jgi:hypothetical protein
MHQLRRALLIIGLITLAFLYRQYMTDWNPPNTISRSTNIRDRWRALGLAGEQCTAEFPRLGKEIENAVADGAFVLKKAEDDVPGLIQGRIKDGKVCIPFAIGGFVLERGG